MRALLCLCVGMVFVCVCVLGCECKPGGSDAIGSGDPIFITGNLSLGVVKWFLKKQELCLTRPSQSLLGLTTISVESHAVSKDLGSPFRHDTQIRRKASIMIDLP